MKTVLLLFLPLIGFAQDTTALCYSTFGYRVSGDFSGYVGANFIVIDSAHVHDAHLYATRYFVSESTIDSSATLHVINCEENAKTCVDHFIPRIAALKDSCITDEEWNNDGYLVITDSAALHSLEAMMLYQKFGCYAADDCGIDSFYVKEVVITPPGGVSRPPGGTRRFDITFRAVDFKGQSKEVVMTWVRNNDPNCELD